jgi:hypothetical protein
MSVANRCSACEPTGFDVAHRRLAEEALVLAVELTRALIAHFEGCARRMLKAITQNRCPWRNSQKLHARASRLCIIISAP